MLPGYWSPPSGRIEEGESQPQAVVREMREELGLGVRPVRKAWECLTDDGRYRLHWWVVEEDGALLRPAPDEVAGTRWVDATEFAAISPTFEGDRVFFREVWPRLD